MKRIVSSMVHTVCRNSVYPSTNIERFKVPEDKVDWNIDFAEYSPIIYTSKGISGQSWADKDIQDLSFKPKWNEIDGKVNRASFECQYIIDKHNYPLNPCGRTGIKGRGILGRWGPNHAADPIVTKWKKNTDNSIQIDDTTTKPILQFVGIQRRDSGEWALPGGMVDPGEKVSITLHREFMEEAMNSLEKSEQELMKAKELIEKFFNRGQEIYKGYVDDPRNTDNAWMETVAYNFHDETGEFVGNLKLQAGDDAKKVKWVDISSDLILYASHRDIIMKVAQLHKAHW